MSHKLNTLGVLVATLIFYVCQWQIDLWVSPYVWNNIHWLEVLPFWFMWNTEAYCLGFAVLNLAYWIGLVSLWFWEDDPPKKKRKKKV